MSKATKEKLFLISPMLHQGGFERVCITTARILDAVFDVTIVIFSDADIAFDITGLNIVNLDVPTRDGRINKAVNVLKRVCALRKLIKKDEPRVIYSFGQTANIVNALTPKKGATSTWLGLRGYTDLYEEAKMKLFVNRADAIIACSKQMAFDVRAKYDFDNVYTLYNPYDVEKIAEDAKGEIRDCPFKIDKRHTLIALGRDDELKCYWHMIKAFKLVHDRVPEARLLILGDGEFINDRKLVEALNIGDSVWFAGMRTDPYRFLNKAGIYLMTSSHEGFPNALVEGMSLGLAPVSTNCLTGPAEILLKDEDAAVEKAEELIKVAGSYLKADYGILVSLMSEDRDGDDLTTCEEESYANAIIELMTDDELYEHYSKKAVERASKFTYGAYRDNFINIYNQEINR